MKHLKETLSFVDHLVVCYSEYNKADKSYNLYQQDIPDFELAKLSAYILRDESIANETIGPDNLSFHSKMMPALITFLLDITDKDNQIDFINIWRESIASHHEEIINELLQTSIDQYNQIKGCTYNNVHSGEKRSKEYPIWTY